MKIRDNTFVDGYMQNENYIIPIKNELNTWFSVSGDFFDGCTISLRGGEYRNVKSLFLPPSYYANAIRHMLNIEPQMKFRVVTDDISLANEYFPDFPIISSGGVKIYGGHFYRSPKSFKIGKDFSAIQNSRYLILSNSSFSWWGAWTNQNVEQVIAPKYWAEFNRSTGYWSQGGSLTTSWDWLDRHGELYSWEQCQGEIKTYRES